MIKSTKYLALWLTALSVLGIGGGLLTSCSPDTENVFGDSPAKRQQQAASQYADILEAQELGWAVDFYPSELEFGGIAYTALFKDGHVTLACEQAINNTSVEGYAQGRHAATEEVTSDYRIVNGRGVMLTFDTYNSLLHYWSQPSGTDFDGYASDYEFTFVCASADSVVLRGVKHGNLLRMYPLHESSKDYLNQVIAMRSLLEKDTRKRAVVDGTVIPITAMENHMAYPVGDEIRNMPYVYTATGLRFYQPVVMNGVSEMEMTFDATTESLRSADGRMELPRPTALERFCGASTQWHFIYGKTDDSFEMCDELRNVFKTASDQLSRQRFETMKDVYIGMNKLSRSDDAQRIVMGWTSSYSSWAYEVCHGIDMTVTDEQHATIDIKATTSGNLYYNYATVLSPMLSFVTSNSPYVLTFDNTDNPTTVTLTSKADANKWFTLKIK